MRIYKFIFFSLCLVFLFSGCSTSKQTLDENSAGESHNNDQEVIDRINDIKNGLTPQVKPAKPAANKSMENQEVKLEDLASQYGGAILKTNFGDIKVGFYADESPITVNNFLNLAKSGFYNGTKFHRVMADFMIQGGDPNSKDDDWSNDGMGGPGYKFQDEFNSHKLVRGSLAMANSGADTNGSQFFIVTTESTPWLDGKHTNFGQVIDGLDVVDKIEAVEVNENDHPITDVIIENIELIVKSS